MCDIKNPTQMDEKTTIDNTMEEMSTEERTPSKKRWLLKSLFYLFTLACIGFLGWTLFDAYKAYPRFRLYWWGGVGGVATVAMASLLLTILLRGKKRYVQHIVLMQVLPLAIAVMLCFVPTFVNRYVRQCSNKGGCNKWEKTFNDVNTTQLNAAQKNGIEKTLKNRSEAKQRIASKEGVPLVRIKTNDLYYVRPLTYSMPYVVPKVRTLLNDIAKEFQRITGSRARFEVTSVLRTEKDIKGLKKSGNTIAVDMSCHSYGTTIDISYACFRGDINKPMSTAKMREALSRAISKLHQQGRCYVKFERGSKCYHITVR